MVAMTLALAAGVPAARAGDLKARVMVLPAPTPAPGDPRLADDVSEALSRGARRVTPNVARSTASLGDTAVIVGCDPAAKACLDAVAAALNVDQVLHVQLGSEGDAVTVDVTAVSRETQPVSRRFLVRAATRKEDLAAIEAAVPAMLDAEAAGRTPGGGDGTPGGGDSTPGGGDGTPGGGDTRGAMGVTIAGGALIVGGAVFWALAAAKQGEIDDAPTTSAADLVRLEELEASGDRRATIGNALILAGGITAVAGAVWWWRASRTRDRRPAAGTLMVTPVVGADRGGVMLEGRW